MEPHSAICFLAPPASEEIFGLGGSDELRGDGGNDTIYGGSTFSDSEDDADVIFGGAGRDLLYGNGGNDWLQGGDNSDTLYGGFGDDTLLGGDLEENIGDGGDLIIAGPGMDNVIGGAGGDTLYGGMGETDATDAADRIAGDSGNDLIYGNGGDDVLLGDSGNDTLYGGLGLNTLIGGEGNDTLIANTALDILIGGEGTDTFVIDGRTAVESQINATQPQLLGSAPMLNIADLSAGESIRITNLTAGSDVQIGTDSSGNIVLQTGTGQVLALLGGEEAATLDINITEVPNGSTFNGTTQVDVAVAVGGGASSGGGGPTNSAPSLVGLDPVTFLENTVNAAAQVIDAAATFTDDNADLDGGNLTITYSAGGGAEDSLSFVNVGAGAGQIGWDGTTASYEGTAIGTVNGGNSGTAGNSLILDLNANATPVAVDALIQNLTYANSSDTPTGGRTISITVNDGVLTSAAATLEITVTPEADATLALSALNGTNGFRLDGIDANDISGASTSSAGDINGDGFEDILIGTYGAAAGAGESYVIFGSASGWAASFDLSTLDGSNGFLLGGTDAGDSLGYDVGKAGDVNDDGIDDLIIGAIGADPSGNNGAGESYILFGKNTAFSPTIDLSALDGTDGFRLDGVVAAGASGYSVFSAGDINGDGIGDIFTGAWNINPGGVTDAGTAYIVFGKSSAWASSLDLSTLDGNNGFIIEGVDDRGYVGISGDTADYNGDGLDDLLFAEYGGDPAGRTNAGKAYVLFGNTSGFGASFDTSTLDGTNGFRMDGAVTGDATGMSYTSAGDINRDGYDDLIIGGGIYNADGKAHVVFGSATGIPAVLDLATLNGTNGFTLNEVVGGDYAGTDVSSAGDFNGDGFDDVIITASYANGTAGAHYIVFGKSTGWAANINLSTLDGTNGLRLDGIDADDAKTTWVGAEKLGYGDFNGDGFGDVVIGAAGGDPGGDSNAGESYVIFGNNDSGAVDQVGTAGADTLNAAAGGDVIVAGLGNDTVNGGSGDDVIRGANGNDTITGDGGIDRLFGGNGNDNIDGGAAADFLYGDDGDDTLIGDAGNDSIKGGNGDDTHTGGTGADILIGGIGDDVFDFNVAGETSTTNLDVLTLNWDQDTIDISGIAADAGDTINTTGAVVANNLADVVAAYDNTGFDQVGDANLLTVTGGTLAGNEYLIISTDGNATYDEGTDLFMQIIGGGTLDVGDII